QPDQDKVVVSLNGEPILESIGSLSTRQKRGEDHAEFPGQPFTSLFCSSGSYEFTEWKLQIFEGRADILRQARPVTAVKSGNPPSHFAKPWESPEFQKWIALTQKLPAEKQIEAVSKKLMELNPEFDGELTGSQGTG